MPAPADRPKRSPRPRLLTLGWQLVSWVETFLVHGPGDVADERIELDDEECALVVGAYAVDEAGRRTRDEVFYSRPKGRRKSELAGMLCCADALAPGRFDHWAARGETSWWGYEYARGEPVGRPVTWPYVRCLATEEGQAGNTYDNISFMLERLAERHPDYYGGIDLGRSSSTSTRIILPGGGEIIPSTASSAAKDGGKESLAVFDEPHLYVTPELRRMYRVVSRNTGKRKLAEPWKLHTSTMYRPGEDSVAEQIHERARAGTDPRLLLDHVGGNGEVSLANTRELKAELRRVYGPAARWQDLDHIVSEARREPDPADAYRYWLNVAKPGADTWLERDRWQARTARRDVPARTKVAVGFDGSQYDDHTHLRAETLDGYQFTPTFADGTPMRWDPAAFGGEIPRLQVDAAVHLLFTVFDVVRFYADPPYWQTEIDAWAAEFGDKRVFRWETRRDHQMAAALERLLTDVLAEESAFSHDGDLVVAEHVGNARKEQRRGGVVITKERPGSPKKIDGAVTAALAHEAAGDAIAGGALRTRSGKMVVMTR